MDSVVAPQPIDNIKDGYFPFYEHRPGITHPLYAPSFESLPESLQRLFVQTFVEGYQNPSRRVGTEKWIQTLLELRGSEVQCRTNYRHYYFGNNAKCPLCTIEERMESIIVRPKPEPAPTPAPVPEPVIIPPVTEKPKGNKFLVGVLATICAVLAIVLLVDKLDLFNNKTGTSKEMEAYDSIENSTEPPTMTPEMSEAPKAAETTESESDSESSIIENEDDDYDEDEDYDEDADYGEDDMFIFPDSDSRFLKKSDLKGLTAYECRLARNEIYARCGRLFDDKKLQKYFDSCSWYDGYIEPEDFNEKKEFNKYEKANSKFILKYEREKGYR